VEEAIKGNSMSILDRALIIACGFNMGIFLTLTLIPEKRTKTHIFSLILATLAVGFCLWG
jgi:hypothetical protein